MHIVYTRNADAIDFIRKTPRVLCRAVLRHYGFARPKASRPARVPNKRAGFPKTRIEAFSDGVFAVALTLLIVHLSTADFPKHFTAKDWHEFWPSFAAWFASTGAIGMYWVAHHNELDHVESFDRIMLWTNLLFLVLIVLFPFSSRMLGAYWTEEDELLRRVPILVYGSNLILAGLMLGWFWRYAARPEKYHLTYKDASYPEIYMTDRRNALVPEIGTILLIVGLSAPLAAQISLVLLPAVYISASVWYAVRRERLRGSGRITALKAVGRNVPLPRRVVRFHELARETGVRVQSTASDGAARAAGMLSGDIIVAVNGVAVGDVDELHRLMTEERVCKPVPITVLRQTQKLEITVPPRESPPRMAA